MGHQLIQPPADSESQILGFEDQSRFFYFGGRRQITIRASECFKRVGVRSGVA